MPLDLLFTLANTAVLPAWLLLLIAPRRRWSARLIGGVVVPLALALIYSFLIFRFWGEAEGGFGSMEEVSLLFQQPGILAAGWIHYLAFDLFIGSWEVRDSQRLGIRHVYVVPCLLLTLLFGPAGLGLYLLVRSIKQRRLDLGDRAEPA